jgi:hypothetical protein
MQEIAGFLRIASEVLVNRRAMKVVNIPSTKTKKKFVAQVRAHTRQAASLRKGARRLSNPSIRHAARWIA